jgi:hypothetical protein
MRVYPIARVSGAGCRLMFPSEIGTVALGECMGVKEAR